MLDLLKASRLTRKYKQRSFGGLHRRCRRRQQGNKKTIDSRILSFVGAYSVVGRAVALYLVPRPTVLHRILNMFSDWRQHTAVGYSKAAACSFLQRVGKFRAGTKYASRDGPSWGGKYYPYSRDQAQLQALWERKLAFCRAAPSINVQTQCLPCIEPESFGF